MHCVLLNADYTFLNMVHWKRAMCLIAKGKVQVLRESEKTIHGAEGLVMRIPAVMRLIKLIRTLYKNRVPFSKKNVLIRDGFRCAYCGAQKTPLTIDHIIPRARGGTTCFENCVASCRSCNTRKGSRIPSEVNMFLKTKAYQPTIAEFLRMKIRNLGLYDVLKELGIY